jgi:hypothetical protein
MANLTEWVTSKFEQPLPLLFFLLGALLLLLGVTTGLEVPMLKQLTPDGNYRWVSIVLGCVFLFVATLIYSMPVVRRRTWYGIEITSPAKNEGRDGEITVTGKYKRLPRQKDLFLVNVSPDHAGFYPQVNPHQEIKCEKDGSWHGSAFINSDTIIIVTTISPAALTLFKYYQKVGEQTKQWVPIDKLPDPPDVEKHDEVFVRCKRG